MISEESQEESPKKPKSRVAVLGNDPDYTRYLKSDFALFTSVFNK